LDEHKPNHPHDDLSDDPDDYHYNSIHYKYHYKQNYFSELPIPHQHQYNHDYNFKHQHLD
jgi:hypothetical protein